MQEIIDIVKEFEARASRHPGLVASRYVAELEPETFYQLAQETGLTEQELWRYILNEERRAARPTAPESSEPIRGEAQFQHRLQRLEAGDENIGGELQLNQMDESEPA